MSILLKLFLTFLEIGAVSFGGGYAMISLIREKALINAWLSEGELLNMIAIAESTPGPIAVNMATFVGSSQAGFFGALLATLGVVLPSFIIILLVASVMKGALKRSGVQAALSGIRPCVISLIFGVGITMGLKLLFGITDVYNGASVDLRAIIIFAILITIALAYKKILKKRPSPILMILISAVLGMTIYSI